MNKQSNPKSLERNLVIQELTDETLIYDLTKDKAFCLNATAAFIWRHADGATPVKQIAYLLQKKLQTPVDEAVVWFALEKFAKDGLLAESPAAPCNFSGMDRRALIKTLGKSAAVALPLVMTVTAPHAVAAVSVCLDLNQPCQVADQPCCPGSSCFFTTTSGPVCLSNSGGSGPGGGCVLWDTEITTAEGASLRARDVVSGQMLLGVNCLNGERVAGRVKQVFEKETHGVYSIVAENGAVVNCSPTHHLIKGFGDTQGSLAEGFRIGDPLLVLDQRSRKIVEAKTVAISRAEIFQPVLMFAMESAEHTFITEGIISHNKVVEP